MIQSDVVKLGHFGRRQQRCRCSRPMSAATHSRTGNEPTAGTPGFLRGFGGVKSTARTDGHRSHRGTTLSNSALSTAATCSSPKQGMIRSLMTLPPLGESTGHWTSRFSIVPAASLGILPAEMPECPLTPGYCLAPRPAQQHTFQVLPRRLVVEHTFAWLRRQRRLSKDYEGLSDEAWIRVAMTGLVLRRLARSPTL